MRFIWANKRPRISKANLFTHRLQGGLGVPQVTKYYLAAQISQLSLLHASSNVPLWVLLELPNCAPLLMQALFWLPQKLWPTSLIPLMLHSLKLWNSVDTRAPLCPPSCLCCPLQITHCSSPGLDQPHAFAWWTPRGLTKARNLLTTHTPPTWPAFCESYDAPQAEFFRFLQIQHWIATLQGTSSYLFQTSAFEYTVYIPRVPRALSPPSTQL